MFQLFWPKLLKQNLKHNFVASINRINWKKNCKSWLGSSWISVQLHWLQLLCYKLPLKVSDHGSRSFQIRIWGPIGWPTPTQLGVPCNFCLIKYPPKRTPEAPEPHWAPWTPGVRVWGVNKPDIHDGPSLQSRCLGVEQRLSEKMEV